MARRALPSCLPLWIAGQPNRCPWLKAVAGDAIRAKAQPETFPSQTLAGHDSPTNFIRWTQGIRRHHLQHKTLTRANVLSATKMQPAPVVHLEQLAQQGTAFLAPTAMHQLPMVDALEPTAAQPARKRKLQLPPYH